MTELLPALLELVGDESIQNIFIGLAASVWAWAQRTAGIDRKNNLKVDQALTFLEAGVSKTYAIYVKARKAASQDGHLTEEEKKEAREMAFTYAKNYAQNEGLSLVKALGADMIPMLIEKSVGNLKTACSGPTAVAPTSAGEVV